MKYAILKHLIRKTYPPILSTAEELDILTSFLLDSYDGISTRKWLANKEYDGITGNQIDITKKGDDLILFDIYDPREKKFEFTISYQLFLKALDQWEIAREAKKQYIIIELADDNKDISIYAVDSIDN
jgi:hypothetical protein